MNKGFVLSFLALAFLSGCVASVPIRLYPVQGPISARKPMPVYEGKASGFWSGTLSVGLDTGEACQGPWKLAHHSPVASAPAQNGLPPDPGAAAPDLSTAWDIIYGSGFYVAHVLGSPYFSRTALTGNRGTVLNVELTNDKNERGNTKGIAQDNHGNLFKLVVQN